MDFQQYSYNRNDNHPLMPAVKMEPGIKLEPIDGLPPQVDAMMQQMEGMGSPQMSHMDGMPSQQQYNPHMQQQQHYDMHQHQQQQYPMGMGMPGMGMNMGPPAGQHMGMMNGMPPSQLPMLPEPPKKKTPGRKKKLKQEKLTDNMKEKKPRRKFDRFHGMPEEEVVKRTLPDLLVHNLDIVIVGINPGLMAAYKGHHYAGPGNHFWKCLYFSGMISEPMTCMDDIRLKDFGIGFTNIVQRTTRGSADLTRKEIKEGAKILTEKMQIFKPLIACFNGKGIYEIFSGKKDFEIGRQPETIPNTNTVIYVMPSSSARCSQFPRAQDKVRFYLTLKELRNDLKGIPNEPRPPEYQDPPAGTPQPTKQSQKKDSKQQVKKIQQQEQQMQIVQQQQQQQMVQHQQQAVQIKPDPGLYDTNQQACPQQQPQMHMPQQQQPQQPAVHIKQEPGLYDTNQQGCPQQQQQQIQHHQQHMQPHQQMQQMQQRQQMHQQMQSQQQIQQQQQQQQHFHQPVHIKQEPGLYDMNQGCPQQQPQQQQIKMEPGVQQSGLRQRMSPPGMQQRMSPPGLQPTGIPQAQGMHQPQGMPYYTNSPQAQHPNIKQEPLDRFSHQQQQQPGVGSQYCGSYPQQPQASNQYTHPMPNIKQEPGTMAMMGMRHFMDDIPNISTTGATRVTNVLSMGNQGSPNMGHQASPSMGHQMGPTAGSPGSSQSMRPNPAGSVPSPSPAGDSVPSFGEAFQYMNSTEGLPPT